MAIINEIKRFCLNLFIPTMCAYCKIGTYDRALLCVQCTARINPIVSITLPLTARYELPVLAISAYQDPLKSLILAKSMPDICAAAQLGTLMWQMTYIRHKPIDYFVPIPLHWMRQARRGFNQAEEMARAISRASGKPMALLLKRSKMTRFQSELKGSEREQNVRDAFMLTTKKPELYRDKHLVLVDDLMTTGSTAAAAARQLIALKPASLTLLVACRVV